MTTWPNWVDLIVVTIFIKTCYSGLGGGFLAELLHLIGLIGAISTSINYFGPVAQWLAPWMAWFGPDVSEVLVFFILLLSLTLCVHLLIGRIARWIKWEQFHWILQGLGLMLGGLRGLWWAGLIVVVLASSKIPYLQESLMKESVLGPRLEQVAREAFSQAADRFPGAGQRKSLVPQLALPPAGRTTK